MRLLGRLGLCDKLIYGNASRTFPLRKARPPTSHPMGADRPCGLQGSLQERCAEGGVSGREMAEGQTKRAPMWVP